MFITIQFPVVDYRYMYNTVAKLDRPLWPRPDAEEDWMLYFGRIFNRDTLYKGPWDDEKRYCNVRNVFNFCGLGDPSFRYTLQEPYESRILFRRFQSDGKFLSKFEIGFYDSFELKSRESAINPAIVQDLIYQHINRYLLCPLKIKVGSRLTNFVPLIHCGKHLANSYFWSTYKTNNKRTFTNEETEINVVKCEPVVLVHLNSFEIDLSLLSSKEVSNSIGNASNGSLFFDHVTHKYKEGNYHIKTWIIGTTENRRNLPLLNKEFQNYDEKIRYLRINLLRIHSERAVLKEVTEKIANQIENAQFNNSGTQKRVYLYLNNILKNLSNSYRNNQNQEELVSVAFELDKISSDENIDSQIEGLKTIMKWLENFEQQNRQTINFIENIINKTTNIVDGDQITIGTINGNFLNKSQLINSLNTVTSNGWDDNVKKEMIAIGKKIEDSEDVVAGPIFDKFTEEMAKPKEVQNKSTLKKIWDGLVKVLPDALIIGKTIAGIVALF